MGILSDPQTMNEMLERVYYSGTYFESVNPQKTLPVIKVVRNFRFVLYLCHHESLDFNSSQLLYNAEQTRFKSINEIPIFISSFPTIGGNELRNRLKYDQENENHDKDSEIR